MSVQITVRSCPPEMVIRVLCTGYAARLVVTGQSMRPTIRDGEAVLVVPVHERSLRPGDIVLYVRAHRLWAHRIVRRQTLSGALWLVTQGDGTCRPDPPIAALAVIGRIVAVERSGRWQRLDTRWQRYRGWVLRAIRRWRCRLGFCQWCPHLA